MKHLSSLCRFRDHFYGRIMDRTKCDLDRYGCKENDHIKLSICPNETNITLMSAPSL